MIVSFRVADDLLTEIDRVARTQGMTRSAWMVAQLTRSVLVDSNENLPLIPGGRAGEGDALKRITIRLESREVGAIETVAAGCGLNRTEWIKRTIRWQLWDKAGTLKLAPITQYEIGQVRKQVLRIGRTVNKAAGAVHTAMGSGGSGEVARIAEDFKRVSAEAQTVIMDARLTLSHFVSGEVSYWTGAHGKPAE
jgi:hypothetical protein